MKAYEELVKGLKIELGYGDAKYTMKRGTFKTKDQIKNVRQFLFEGVVSNKYKFTDGSDFFYIEHRHHAISEFKIVCDLPYNRMWIYLPSKEDEAFFGCGEQFTHFNLKGKCVKNWVSEHHSLNKLIRKAIRENVFGVNPSHRTDYKNHQTYYAQPTFVSSDLYFLHCDTHAYSEFDFRRPETTVLYFREIPKSFYVGYANSYSELSELLSSCVGKQPTLPEWTGKGAIIASQGGLETAVNTVKKAQNSGAKVVGIWCQDWSGQIVTGFGTQVYWNWSLDETLYEGLKDQIESWKSEGIKFLGYINTFLKQDVPMYQEAESRGYLVKNFKGSPYHISATTFKAGIVDLTNPEAFKWYKNKIKENMIDLGFSGWMADFGEYLPTDAVVYSSEAPEKLHNAWPELWSKLNREIIDECGVQNEVFFFTRAGYTETIKYSNSMWSGDQHVDFSDEYGMPSVICSTLSLAMSGIGINHSDVGGYTTIFHMKRSEELLMRWGEINIFTPLFRYHEGNRPNSNAQFDHSEKSIMHFSKMSQYFHQLSPYLEYNKKQYEKFGIPVNRPVFYHYENKDQFETPTSFLYGRDVLVAPVLRQNQASVEVTLPEDEWIHLFTKKVYSSGTHTVESPLGVPCAFYRRASEFAELFEQL
ncbi:MAG: alpha-glucosidase [Clostridia bacterium]|nr:alpha-glucosidase [Clostridia bacterium]